MDRDEIRVTFANRVGIEGAMYTTFRWIATKQGPRFRDNLLHGWTDPVPLPQSGPPDCPLSTPYQRKKQHNVRSSPQQDGFKRLLHFMTVIHMLDVYIVGTLYRGEGVASIRVASVDGGLLEISSIRIVLRNMQTLGRQISRTIFGQPYCTSLRSWFRLSD